MKTSYIKVGLPVIGLLMLILDPQTAINGVQSGITVCLQSAIPSLLPFLVLTKYLTQQLYGVTIPLFSWICRLCGIPGRMESIFGIGLIGGYPIGAQLIADARKERRLDEQTAARLLGFCNNPGPAFIFGVCGGLFNFSGAGWCILVIQILSAVLCGMMLPGKKTGCCEITGKVPPSFVKNLEAAVRTMAMICGWIVCFRVVITYLDSYLSMRSVVLRVSFCGFLELTNGCTMLNDIPFGSIRFIITNGLLSFGGLCVWMQIRAAAKELPMKWFYIGKVVQCLISISLAGMVQVFLFDEGIFLTRITIALVCVTMMIGIFSAFYGKKVVAFWRKVLYDRGNKKQSRCLYAVPKEN